MDVKLFIQHVKKTKYIIQSNTKKLTTCHQSKISKGLISVLNLIEQRSASDSYFSE